MSKIILIFLIFSCTVWANSSVIWGPGQVSLSLQPYLQLTSGGPGVYQGTTDPTIVAFSASKGSLYLDTINGSLYVKQDNGLTTNWVNALTNANGWSLTGNPGTIPGTNFLGTTDNQDLVIKTNNTEGLRVTSAQVTRHPIGSAAAPTVTFASALTTGLYSPAANSFGISANGTQWLNVDSSGNGTVNGTGATGSLRIKSRVDALDAGLQLEGPGAGGNRFWDLYINPGGDFSLYNPGAGVTGLSVSQSNGFVGIGPQAAGNQLSVISASSATDPSLIDASVGGPIVGAKNSSSTAGNYSAFATQSNNTTNAIDNLFLGVHDDHAAKTGHIELWTETATVLAKRASISGTSFNVYEPIDVSTNKIINVVDPTAAQDAATKNYVDSVASGLNPLQGVYAASTAIIAGTYFNGVACVGATFTTTSTATFTMDGVTPPLNSRVLFKDQPPNGFQNGVYNLTALPVPGVSGAVFTRSLDYDTAGDVNAGDLIPVINGTLNAKTSWLQTATVTTCGSDNLVFTQWSYDPTTLLKNTLTGAHVFVGNGSNVATDTAVTGDITITNAGVTAIGTNKVTNSQLAQMPAHTYKGNNTGSTANAIDLTQAQITAELNLFSSSLQGAVTASGGGTTNFLRADGLWAAPSGSGVSPSEVVFDTPNGFGAGGVANRIRNFTNITTVGTDITGTVSGTNGATALINTTGNYVSCWNDFSSGGDDIMGFSINASGSQLTSTTGNIANLPGSVVFTYNDAINARNASVCTTKQITATSIVRPHTANGVLNGTNSNQKWIINRVN